MDPNQLGSWWAIAREIGAGASFILGIVAYCLWFRLSSEQDYSRKRDKETLDVLNSISQLVSQGEREAETHADKVLAAVASCQTTILSHIDSLRKS